MKNASAILVVSHDRDLADVRKRRLEEAGYEVISAMDVQSIRLACATKSIGLAVIGYSLPPAEERRVGLEIRQACGRQTPVLQLERVQNVVSIMGTAALGHHPERSDSFIDHIRQLLA